MSELINVNLNQLPSTQVGTDETFNELAKRSDFPGRLKLFTKGKAIDRGLIAPGHYGIPVDDNEVIDLGVEIDIVPLARTPFAIDMSDGEAVLRSYDHECELFQKIATKSLESNSKCQYGPRFLVFERSSGRFLEFFCGSKSLRGFAKTLYSYMPLTESDIKARGLTGVEPHMPKPITMKAKLVEKGDWSWHVPKAHSCSTPFTNFPSMKVIVKEIQRFLDVKDEDVEIVEETESPRRAR